MGAWVRAWTTVDGSWGMEQGGLEGGLPFQTGEFSGSVGTTGGLRREVWDRVDTEGCRGLVWRGTSTAGSCLRPARFDSNAQVERKHGRAEQRSLRAFDLGVALDEGAACERRSGGTDRSGRREREGSAACFPGELLH